MIRRAFFGALLLGLATSGEARADDRVDPVLERSSIGLPLGEARELFGGLGLKEVRWLAETDHQALADGLVRSKLLETLNRLHLSPVDGSGSLDKDAFIAIAVAGGAGRSYTAAFGDNGRGEAPRPPHGARAGPSGPLSAPGDNGRGEAPRPPHGGDRSQPQPSLRFLLVRIPVPVDPSAGAATAGSSPERLHRLRDALEELRRAGFALTPTAIDRYGNRFGWSGNRGKNGAIAVLYLPEEDELRVVLYKG